MQPFPIFSKVAQPFINWRRGFLLSPKQFLILCFSEYGCNMLRSHFPVIAERYQASIDYMKANYGIEAKFGLFFNFCLNAPRPGVRRVFCRPHVDWKNIAFGLCMIFVYGEPVYTLWSWFTEVCTGHFNHGEKCWLVIWEAGIVVELPPGVFIFYPSSLFLHFNVDLSHVYNLALSFKSCILSCFLRPSHLYNIKWWMPYTR